MGLPVYRCSFITNTSLFPATLLQGGKIALCKKNRLYSYSATSVLSLVLLFSTESHLQAGQEEGNVH